MIKKGILLLVLINISFCTAFAQTDVNSKIETLGIFSGGDNAPFWLTNNKYGIGSTDKNKQYLRAGSTIEKQLSSDWNIYGGIDLVGSNGFESHFFVQQAFVDVAFKKISLSVGMKEREVLFKDNDLFSGSMTRSINSRPVPQVELSTPEFIALPFTNGWIDVKGELSYGIFTDNKFKVKNAENGYYPKNVLYHHKAGFLKIEKDTPWNIILGLEMDTQFGGKFYKKGEYHSSSPTKFIDFLKVIIPMAGGSDSNGTDQVNILGNVYGSTHFIFNYNLKKFAIKAYHEHFFEDHSGLIFKNIPDGVYGIELTTKKKSPISGILLEYVYTKNQSGPFLWDKNSEIPIQVSGGDNYYNQIDYLSISNYGFTMGSPLLTSPIYNKGTSLMVKHSRISAFHAGISGNISNEVDYKLLLTYTQSWGTPFVPTQSIKDQFSSMLECSYSPQKLEGWKFSGAFAFDKSSMIGDNQGFQLTVSKSFNSRF